MIQDGRGGKRPAAEAGATILGSGATLKGELLCTGSVRVEGQVDGSIKSQNTVLLKEGAKVKGNLRGAEVIVSGEILGNIFASQRVELQPSGRLQGNINAPQVSIREGAFFQGECLMTKKEVAPPVEKAAPKKVETPAPPKQEEIPEEPVKEADKADETVADKVEADKAPQEKPAQVKQQANRPSGGRKGGDRRNRR